MLLFLNFFASNLQPQTFISLYSPRQTTGSKDIIGIQGGFDPVHDFPFRPGGTEDIISFLEIIRRLKQQPMPVMLVDSSA